MFTGIIQRVGSVRFLNRQNRECRFCFNLRPAFENLQAGESIAVNGACLSVENHDADGFCAYASKETMERTNLGFLRPGDKVNLERALAFGERLGGHLVSGHVDCLARVEKKEQAGQSFLFRFSFPQEFSDQIISKGSIALDGISLTINDCGADFLEVNVIPDSQKRANTDAWKPGVLVNMETDLIGKYVINYLRKSTENPSARQTKRVLDEDFLARNGFM